MATQMVNGEAKSKTYHGVHIISSMAVKITGHILQHRCQPLAWHSQRHYERGVTAFGIDGYFGLHRASSGRGSRMSSNFSMRQLNTETERQPNNRIAIKLTTTPPANRSLCHK
jgi:hypothetical protein